MRSVLVIDDEKWIREGIKSKLKKNGILPENVGEAENGLQALEMMKERAYDIVISDICMNDMDGLKLCELLSRDHPKTQKILVSGYSEFDYATKAIQEGVVSYLLKPVDTEQLLSALKLCEKRLLLEETRTDADIQQVYNQIYTISENYEARLNQKEAIKDLFSGYQPSAVTFGCCYLYLGEHADVSPNEMLSLLLKACNGYHYGKDLQILKTSPYEYAVICMQPSHLALLKAENTVREIANAILAVLEQHPLPYFTLGVSTIENNPLQCLNSGCACMRHRVLMPDVSLILPEDTKGFCNSYQLKESVKLMCLFAVKTGKYHEFSDLLQQIQEDIINNKVSYGDVDQLYQILVNIVLQNTNVPTGQNDSTLKKLWQFHSVQSMFKQVKDFCMSRVNLSIIDEDNMRDTLAYHVKNYIDEHFSEPISLEQLADKHFVTPSYLSVTFKKIIQVNFLDYLTHVRLNVAKELLMQKKYTVKSIAAMTGFNDQHYFSRTFKQNEGKTPKQFVDELTENNNNVHNF